MELLNLAQAIKASGVSEKTLRRWIKSGRLTAELIEGPKGREYRINADDLNRARKLAPKKAISEPQPATVEASLDPNDLATLKALAEAQTAMLETLVNRVEQLEGIIIRQEMSIRSLKALPAPATRPTLWERFKSWVKPN